jgi:NAD(P)H dehydrogenase (quinone)
MKTLIIYAHPDTGGHCPAILDSVKAELAMRREKYEVLDLYKMKYDPVLHEEEHYTRGGKVISKQNKDIQKKITESDRLIFIYPVWWGSMPAMMKGLIDKTFTSDFAFKYENGLPQGLLKGKRALIFITSGSPSFFSCLLLGNRYVLTIKKDILGFCGVKSRVRLLGSSNKFDDSRKELVAKTVKSEIEKFYSR